MSTVPMSTTAVPKSMTTVPMAQTFKCTDPRDRNRWCEISIRVTTRPMTTKTHAASPPLCHDVTYTFRYSQAPETCADLHPFGNATGATHHRVVPATAATREWLDVLLRSDEHVIEAAGRSMAHVSRCAEMREQAAAAYRRVAMQALATL